MRRYLATLWVLIAVLVTPLTTTTTATAARPETGTTETYRLMVLGHAPPRQTFVAMYSHPPDDGRSPGLKSPPAGGGGSGSPPSTAIVLCGKATKRDFPAGAMWDVRKVLGSGERECHGDGAVYTRTITVPPGQEPYQDARFLRISDHKVERFICPTGTRGAEGDEGKTGVTHSAYYDFRIGAGRVGSPPTLADRRFEVDFSLDLRGRVPRDLVVHGVVFTESGAGWNVLCAGPGYKHKDQMREPGRRCQGRLDMGGGYPEIEQPPGSSFTYAFVRGDAGPNSYGGSESGAKPGTLTSCDAVTRALVCGTVTLDSDTSVRAWYDFDKGEGGARVLQHPYEMPSAGGGGMAQGHPLRHAAPIGSVLALTSGALLWCWPGLTVRGARRPRDDR